MDMYSAVCGQDLRLRTSTYCMPMVQWQRFVAIAFDIAKGKGAQFENIQEGGDFLTQLSAVWERDKDRILQMTERQARNYLEDKVSA